jgi:SAM-dependent methyltransferase
MPPPDGGLQGDHYIHCPICGPGAGFSIKYAEDADVGQLDFAARKLSWHMHWRIVECDDCGLTYSNPIASPDKIRRLYRDSAFVDETQIDNMADDYINEVMAIADPAASPRLLEIGCASGYFLTRALDRGFDAVGVEPGMAAVAHSPAHTRSRIVNDELRKGLFDPGSFDVVCAFQIFDHVLDPNEFLALVHHYLKPGGKLVQIHHDITSFLPRALGRRASTYDVEHIHLWSPATMQKILSKNGFTPVRVARIGNAYQLDHVVRQLPLPEFMKRVIRRAAKVVGASDFVLRARVENMLVYSVRL